MGVLTGENVEETRREDVKVSFGDELEKILLTAVENGDVQFIQNIFRRETELLQNIVRKRAFDYIEDGVQLSGSDVEAAKDAVDRIKVVMEETIKLLKDSEIEISNFLQDINLKEPSSGETLLSALKFIRSVYRTSEENMKHSLLTKDQSL